MVPMAAITGDCTDVDDLTGAFARVRLRGFGVEDIARHVSRDDQVGTGGSHSILQRSTRTIPLIVRSSGSQSL